MIITYHGNSQVRNTTEFEVLFADASVHWPPWSQDLFQTTHYENFCREIPQLFPLIYDVKQAKKMISELNKRPITEVSPGETAYVSLCSYGAAWYDKLGLPDPYHTTYVVKYEYKRWHDKKKTKIIAGCKLLHDKDFILDHFLIKSYGSIKTHNKDTMVTINNEYLTKYPNINTENLN